VTARAEADAAVVAVRDSGAGIAAEFLPRVFEMFRQYEERSPQGGLGLGLALTRQIVERHGGIIEVRSEGVGRGAEFIVRLPWRPHPPGKGTDSGHRVHRMPGSRLTSS
jgi:signal transduction histidine kinase